MYVKVSQQNWQPHACPTGLMELENCDSMVGPSSAMPCMPQSLQNARAVSSPQSMDAVQWSSG